MQDFDYCKSEFEWFLSVQYKDILNLKDKINEFCHNFCFDDLYDDNKINQLFGNDIESKKRYLKLNTTTRGNNDCDDSKLARYVYFLIWHDKLPLLTSLKNMEENYGGETINTFNTLFQEELEGAKLYIDECDTEFYNVVNNFKKKYLTIGNFMLLPKNSSNNTSLNKAKGNCFNKYKDYADLFFIELFKENSELEDLKKANNFYFKKIGFKKFCEINFLDDYFEGNQFKIIFKHAIYNGIYYPLYWWKYKYPKEFKNYYKTFTTDYIKTTTEIIINNRADRISELLNDIYKN